MATMDCLKRHEPEPPQCKRISSQQGAESWKAARTVREITRVPSSAVSRAFVRRFYEGLSSDPPVLKASRWCTPQNWKAYCQPTNGFMVDVIPLHTPPKLSSLARSVLWNESEYFQSGKVCMDPAAENRVRRLKDSIRKAAIRGRELRTQRRDLMTFQMVSMWSSINCVF